MSRTCVVKRIKLDEITNICNDILRAFTAIFQQWRICSLRLSQVFYHKMKGDHFRYLAEFKAGQERIERKEATDQSLSSHQAVMSNNRFVFESPN
ncbi:hypothetical protein L7F22_055271 [Adiantum nelumboides]|nr:hypothetical protein [Adiantum nelumboides]